MRGAFLPILSVLVLLAGCRQPATESLHDVAPEPSAAVALPTAAACGGTERMQCPAGQFCETAPGQCDNPDAAGVCVQVAEMCTREYQPVCGCDGKTYGNRCVARASQVNIAHAGECMPITEGSARKPAS